MTLMKRLLLVLALGALLGGVGFAWFSPRLIEWYFSPPSDLAFSCKPAVEWAITTYRKVIFTGMLMGGIATSLLFFALQSRKSTKQAELAGLAEEKKGGNGV
jgi:hypothetical protein